MPLYCHTEGCPPEPTPQCLDQVRQRVEKISLKEGFDADTAADLAVDVVIGLIQAVRRGTRINNVWAYAVTIYKARRADLFERRSKAPDVTLMGLAIQEIKEIGVEDELPSDGLTPMVSHSPQAIANMVDFAASQGFSEGELVTLGYWLYGFSARGMAEDFTENRKLPLSVEAAQQRMYRMKARLTEILARLREERP